MNRNDVVQNAFLDNLGTDWVAIDARGNAVCRAGDEAAVRRAVPHAAAYMSAKEFVPADVLDTDPPERAPAPVPRSAARSAAKEPEPEPAADSAPPAPTFDHDGDGKPGGSLPGRRRKAK